MKVVTLGRSHDNDYVINDISISRHHSQIILTDDGRFMILDMGSVNGTYVNGNKITGETLITSSDVIRVGKVDLDWLHVLNQLQSEVRTSDSMKDSNKTALIVVSILSVALLLLSLGILLNFRREKHRAEQEIIRLTEKTEKYEDDIKLSENENKLQQKIKGTYSKALDDVRKESAETKRMSEIAMADAKRISDSIRMELLQAQNDYKNYKATVSASEVKQNNLLHEKEAKIVELSEMKEKADEVMEGMKRELDQMKADHDVVIENLEEFYDLLNSLSMKECRAVCQELEYDFTDVTDIKVLLIKKFKAGDVEKVMAALRAKKNRAEAGNDNPEEL